MKKQQYGVGFTTTVYLHRILVSDAYQSIQVKTTLKRKTSATIKTSTIWLAIDAAKHGLEFKHQHMQFSQVSTPARLAAL